MKRVTGLLGLLLLLPSLASAQEPRFFPVGLHIRSLSELTKLGPEIKAAGFNSVLADGPLGASMIPGLWQAHTLGLRVYLSAAALGLASSSDPDAVRDNVQKLYDLASWTRGHPAYAGMWLRVEGLRPELKQTYLMAAKSGNPAGEILEAASSPLLPADKTVEAAGAALKAGALGLFFPSPTGDRALALPDLPLSASLPLPATPSRQEVFASESVSPLVWTLKRYGEVSPHGLAPYRTPDGSTGYTVTGRALLDLPLLNRAALVDAKRLTRFSMRAFSSVDGQGALLALSSAGEVSYVRLPLQGGWHVYQLDLGQATWESQVAAGLQWGGSTGTVQALSLIPVPQERAQLAFDWIRLEPPSTGEVLWPMQKAEELVTAEGLAGMTIGGGEIRGKATAERVSLELALPAGGLDVSRLPFLSLVGVPGEGQAEITIWPTPGGPASTAKLSWNRAQDAQCFDLRHACFLGGFGVYWDTLPGPLPRLRVTLPATPGEDFRLSGVRLGPNWDLRAAPTEAVPAPPATPEPTGLNPQ